MNEYDSDGAALRHLVAGWRAITAHVSARSNFAISVASIKRWSQREHDPLPIRKWGVGRPRIVADTRALDAWCDAQWQNIAAERAASVPLEPRERQHGRSPSLSASVLAGVKE